MITNELERQARIPLYGSRQLHNAGSFTLAAGQPDHREMSVRTSSDHILRVGLNYSFGGPVIAKY